MGAGMRVVFPGKIGLRKHMRLAFSRRQWQLCSPPPNPLRRFSSSVGVSLPSDLLVASAWAPKTPTCS